MSSKTHTTISVDVDVLYAARAQGVNISNICNHALKNYVQLDPNNVEARRAKLREEIAKFKVNLSTLQTELSTLNSAEEIKRQEEQKEELQKLEQFGQSLKAHNPLEDI